MASEITGWMPEEDGADTALCPYCGCDVVLYDTKEFLPSTALLSSMYMEWFKSEYQERETVATYAPLFRDMTTTCGKTSSFEWRKALGTSWLVRPSSG